MEDTVAENGIRLEYQLASEGVEQAELAGKLFLKELKENDIPLENVRMCYSPFARTRHTAEVVASTLNLPFEGPQCKVMEDLRERYFGPSFELLSHDKMEPSCNDLASRIQAVRIPSILSQHRNFALLTGELRAVR
ncbi:hypothetical protein GOBAR_AA38854 [Gossypium barbadense]|uniref:Uncharacterized protein n=1 Tax=Gossypium barbadense TaxID=3634 RepID=A0A2P5VSQ2_GOSBA|nr:hypothetical protein GOBAR_AA38854 [Gossypium barbadense]